MKRAKQPGDYTISGLGKANPGIKCSFCGEVAPLRSNKAIVEELWRIGHGLFDNEWEPCCKNEDCGYFGVPLSKSAGTYVKFCSSAAGYLGVQPHRGNHTHPVERDVDQDDYDDDLEPFGYHDMVAKEVKKVESKLKKECPGDGKIHPERIVEEMDKLSKITLGVIQNAPTRAPLTSLAKFYIPGSPIGCGGVDSVTVHKGLHCPCERNHKGQKGAKQKQENIAFNVHGRFTLKVGQ